MTNPTHAEAMAYISGLEAELVHVTDPLERTQRLVAGLVKEWPALTASEALSLVRTYHVHEGQ